MIYILYKVTDKGCKQIKYKSNNGQIIFIFVFYLLDTSTDIENPKLLPSVENPKFSYMEQKVWFLALEKLITESQLQSFPITGCLCRDGGCGEFSNTQIQMRNY